MKQLQFPFMKDWIHILEQCFAHLTEAEKKELQDKIGKVVNDYLLERMIDAKEESAKKE